MTTIHSYEDPYLVNLVTAEREGRATQYVATLGAFSADWVARLVVLRTYIITCVECQASPDDLFVQKLKHYRQEFDAVLAQARAATPKQDGSFAFFTIGLERA